MIKQLKISPSGCQTLRKQVLATATDRFAFASTLSVYVYETKNFQLQKLFKFTDQNITSLAWEPQAERYLAQCSADRKLIVWDIESENVRFKATLPSPAVWIEWSKCCEDSILLLLFNGELKHLNLTSKAIVTIEVIENSLPTCARFHPKRDTLAAVGHQDGKVSFVDIKSLQAYTLETSKDPMNSVTDVNFDPGEDHLLVALKDGSLVMIAFEGLDGSTQIQFQYERQNTGINGLNWRDDRSGDFITYSKKVGVIRLWNVASKQPKQVLKVGSAGIHFSQKVKNQPHKLLIAFTNGALSIFDTIKRSIDFQTEAGHAETVFDLEFAPNNKDQVASCSYDGSVRVWDVNQMKLLAVNDTLRNTPISKDGKHIIYSISWHPKESKIALVGSLGYCMVYDALKSKCLGMIQPESVPSFKVDWNPIDPSLILMGSQNNKCIVINAQNVKDLQIQRYFSHPSQVFGVCWSPSIKTQFITGCMDGLVRMFDLSSGNLIKIFEGHEKRVFNVIFNPQLPWLLASGSDDKTIRVWHATEGPTKVLKGHSHNIRAITFNPELPWCLVSGAWDATIKLWDVRSGTCIFTITDHNADVYGLSFHPERPFAFVSSSRDTTLRFWSIDALITSLKMQILVDPTKTKHFDSPEIAYKTKGEYRLSSQFSLKLLTKAKENGFPNKIQQLSTLYCFLNLTEGQEEIMNILDFLSHLDYAPSPKLGDLKVVHAAQIAQALFKKASMLKQATGMQFYNTQYAKKEDRLQEAARIYLRCGHTKEYCETLFELEQYQKAMAFAPAVSIEYWQELAERHAKILDQQNHEGAALASIVSNDCDRAIEIFQQNEDYEDGKLVKALQLTGVFKSVLDSIKSKGQASPAATNERMFEESEILKQKELFKIDPQLVEFVKDESERFFFQGQTLLAAAAFLSINDYKNAIITLIRTNELFLAYYVSKYFYPAALPEVALYLCEKAERFFQTDICLKLLNEDIRDENYQKIFKRRLLNSGLLPKGQEQPQVDFQLESQGLQAYSTGHINKAVQCLILGNKLGKACEVGLELLRESFESSNHQKIMQMFELVELFQNVSLQHVPATWRDQVLLYSAYAGIFKAIWYGLFDIMVVMIQQTLSLADKIQCTDPNLKVFVKAIESALSAGKQMNAQYQKKILNREPLTKIEVSFSGDKTQTAKYQATIKALRDYMKEKSVLLNEEGIYVFRTSGFNLQGHKTSHLTGKLIRGQPYTFEDGKTIVSQEEALEWAMCNRFSPLANGFRVNPF